MIYLDNAATTWQKPPEVYDAVMYAMKNASSPGRGAYSGARRASDIVFEARERLASLFNIDYPERIAFTCNSTQALNTGLKGIAESGDTIVISSMEHNSVLRPAYKMKDQGVNLKIVNADKNGIVNPEEIQKALYGGTKLLCLNHASNVCGSVNDIEKIGSMAKKMGVIFMVDVAQSAGTIPIDVKKCNIDILAFPGHKGLLGPQGTGGIYIGEGITLKTLTEGGTGSLSESYYQPDILPDRYESGTLNVPGIAGLSAGCKFILKHGIDSIAKSERELTKMLAEDLSVIPGVKLYGTGDYLNNAAVLSITTPMDCVELSGRLNSEYKISTRAGLHCAPLAHKTLGTFESGTTRFSPGIFNTKRDIKQTAYAVEKILQQ
ncbi:MAG: aminotransferase class V-fold PLP-dependent enzyme [Bacillota bacterium]|nr:aminotransferase class V-fold PLP-dependent enzyme [Bacillota bacterium]